MLALLAALAAAAPASAAAPPPTVAEAAAPKPRIVWKPIPYGLQRKRDMRRYARRHYGISTHLLKNPKVIVQHWTAGTTWQGAFNTFAPNVRDPELKEKPGVCSHYLIDRDGTIRQLVSTKLMCRHTVGLNYTAIGIEHVGISDADVMGRKRLLRSSLRLTRWLQGRFGISTRNVIGHNENRSSPYHRERVKRLRSQTHGDFTRRTMNRYRRLL